MFIGELLGINRSERRRRRALKRSGADPLARLAVGGAVHASAVRLDTRHARRLDRGGNAVSRTATASAVARVRSGETRELPGRADREADAHRAEQRRLSSSVDLTRPAVDPRWILAVEILIVAFEWMFWFATWSSAIDRRVPWFGEERVAAALLALVTPVIGVAGARLGGGHTHRLLRGHPGVGAFERLGAVCGLGLAVLSMIAIGWLAHWRFTDGAGIGAVEVPAAAMALVFVLVIVVDVLLRIFGDSEEYRQRRRRDRRVVADRRSIARADKRVLTADERARAAWYALRSRVQRVIAQVELIAITGDTIVLDATVDNAVAGHEARTGTRVLAHVTNGGLHLPSTDRQQVLAGPHHVPFPLRHAEDAVAVLRAHPPAGVCGAAEMVEELRRRLAALFPADPTPVHPVPGRLPGRTPFRIARQAGITNGRRPVAGWSK